MKNPESQAEETNEIRHLINSQVEMVAADYKSVHLHLMTKKILILTSICRDFNLWEKLTHQKMNN
jgi:hypothetical protein